MVSILIVNWNTRELLRACLASIEENCAAVEHEVIVVDNGSSDGSAHMVKEEFSRVRLVQAPGNLGFAAGNNLAYDVANGERIWLLNSDTEVLPGAVEALVQFLDKHPQCGAVASALIDARTGGIQRSCRTFPTPGALWAEASGLARAFPRSRRYGFYRMGDWNMRDARRVEQPMASSLMVRATAISAINPAEQEIVFDEQFPIFFNDVDLCWRLWQAGWEIWFCPQSRVRHWGGASTGQARPEMIAESHRALRAFYDKHWSERYSPTLYRATMAMVWLSGRWREQRARAAATASTSDRE